LCSSPAGIIIGSIPVRESPNKGKQKVAVFESVSKAIREYVFPERNPVINSFGLALIVIRDISTN
jgi:hypothetical protein